MSKTILLKNIEKAYQEEIDQSLQAGQALSVDLAIELSIKLHAEIKARGISPDVHADDILLFQYGTYNMGAELGRCFSFDITRQFSKKNFDMFQLSFSLLYDPIEIKSHSAWSMNFESLQAWAEHIKTSEAYRQLSGLRPKAHKLVFTKI